MPSRTAQVSAQFSGGLGPDPPPTASRVAVAVERLTSGPDRKSTRLNSSHVASSYAVFCLKKKMRTYTVQVGRPTRCNRRGPRLCSEPRLLTALSFFFLY